MKLELKSVKVSKNLSHDSLAFTATLYANGKRVATVSDDGWGGGTDYRFTNAKMRKEVEDYAKTINKYGLSCELACMANNIEKEKELKRLTKTNIIYRTKTTPFGVWEMYGYSRGPVIDHGNRDYLVKELKKDLKSEGVEIIELNDGKKYHK